MNLRYIRRLFKKGNVSVFGLRGTGKDMLFANVVARCKKAYISNTNYGGYWIKFDPSVFDCKNVYKNFLEGKLNKFEYPYGDGIDIYLADGGVYMPSQYQGELCRDYGHIATYMALSRHLGDCNFHFNTQALGRMWDKIREQSDLFVRCMWCKVFFKKLVIQKVIIYEKYDSANGCIPPFSLRRPLINPNRVQQWEIQKNAYQVTHGVVKPKLLIYWNKAKYNTRAFKEMLENA